MSMIVTDYYAILGLSRSATQSEIRRAYRELARRYHPDFNPHDPVAAERFIEITRAYHLLCRLEPVPVVEPAQTGPGFQQGAAVSGYDWSRWV